MGVAMFLKIVMHFTSVLINEQNFLIDWWEGGGGGGGGGVFFWIWFLSVLSFVCADWNVKLRLAANRK